MSPASDEAEIRALYQAVLDGWNQRHAGAMAAPFAADGEMIGFDGSQVNGREEIVAHLAPIFAHHIPPIYVAKVRSVRLLGAEAAVLRAVAGMVPHGKSDIEPSLNAIQTVVAARCEGEWRVVLFQTTPAQFHGRPELTEQLTEELRQLLS